MKKPKPIVISKYTKQSPLVVMAGMRGATGKDGDSEFLKAIAGDNISALKVVYSKAGIAYPLDHNDTQHIFYLAGVAISAACKGNPVTIRRYGAVVDPAFNFKLGRVYLGADGVLTQTPVTKGYLVLIGSAIDQQTLLLNIQDPIELEV